MRFTTKITLAAAAAMFLTGVATRASAEDFAQSLASDYQALAQSENAQGDTRDGQTYAARAAAAASGQPTAPDEAGLRQPFLKDMYVGELSEGRQRLVSALGTTGKDNAPAAAARAQSSYDCWLEQASEDLQPDDINACKQAFLAAVGVVEAAVSVVAEAEPPPPPQAAPVAPDTYLVFFDFDKALITPEAMAILDSVEASTDGAAVKRIVAVGHADTSGSDAYNLSLSERRAEAVKSALGGKVRADSIVTEGRGEREPLVPTGDGVREPQNRRVEISVER